MCSSDLLLFNEEKKGLVIVASEGLPDKIIENTVIDNEDRDRKSVV